MAARPEPVGKPEIQVSEETVLEVVRELLRESGPERAVAALTADASFERDLGLGSLERVELLLRIENRFSVRLPDTIMAEVQSPRELTRALAAVSPAKEEVAHKRLASPGKKAALPKTARSLTEALFRNAENDPDRTHIHLFVNDGIEKPITYKALLEGASAAARGLIERGLQPGETVSIMLPTGERFFTSFFGVLLAGGIPVPIYPPLRPDRIEEYARRQVRILGNAGAACLITFHEAETLSRVLKPQVPTLRFVATPESLAAGGVDRSAINGPALLITEESPALIQYTSGSTGNPKGVYLTHRNLLSNIRSIGHAIQVSPSDVGVSWLPLYHDMGLIGSWLFCFYFGIPITILSPLSFLSRPERWLWAIHTHRATLTPAPNFAYEICARRIKDEAIEGLDLSSWRVALNGAEPISPETLSRFTKRYAPRGFKPETLFPVYGMAEASVALTFPPLGRPPRIDRVSRDLFERTHRAAPAGASEPAPLEFVSCGMPIRDHEVRIVDEAGAPAPERVEGEIEFRGPSCTSGYYRQPEATRSLFHDGWLLSGDLGYLAEGELFITGRKKDLIIKGGRNLYPYEIEEVAGNIPGIRKGCVAAFGVKETAQGTEKVVVVAETKEKDRKVRAELEAAIIERTASATGVPPDQVLLVRPGMVPKTSSGKIQRSACREAYLAGRLKGGRPKVSLQFARLAAGSLQGSVNKAIGCAARWAYTGYLAGALAATLPPTWLLVTLSPAGRAAAQWNRKWARLYLHLAGVFPTIQGEENLTGAGPMIFVANHTSYIDAGVLMAILPENVRIVAKQELLKLPMAGTLVRKAEHIPVDRLDFAQSVSTTPKIEAALKAGNSILIFPEGTFGTPLGLGPFKLGAFKAAVETQTPICPITLRGTREVFGKLPPRRGEIKIEIHKPILPAGNDWREIVRLRDITKDEIARRMTGS
ncbi:MAG TPA: AMP-binding protein [Candidatus Manganitrophaceae bacterium]|nr:AMP-binding protein [Candidatus Manganitrophaceae bacterium]